MIRLALKINLRFSVNQTIIELKREKIIMTLRYGNIIINLRFQVIL